ncbi:hypothetical protein [Mucilaginibacter myungsuensis]|uniref:Uncharacterized protein n=1 Tax=Mucilaginibacter myungsuensis TaxID=649104 RepID=A0A929KW25_9SPHI|nr:hypothetical protein [Mucilaginibacter myungsuensis]MBE9662217.1 hypothetical protein [Mucilaginibacter myungsuensis]MDN3599349.1 hypothetical protein [Mucilaginibacter myungsuensis]
MEKEPTQVPPSKKNSNVIYFLIVVVLALLVTDVYLYMQKNKSEDRVANVSDDKTRLQTELDSLEAQIETVTSSRTRLTEEMQAANDSLKTKIRELRRDLAKGKLTKEELEKAQEDVKQLRYFVTKYTADIEALKKQNTTLMAERDTLKTNLNTVSQKATELEAQNQDLNNKVQVASALKIGAGQIVAYKIKGSGKEVDTERSSVAKKIIIDFTIPSNPVAQKGTHDVFLRVIDPAGNLITTPETGTFQSDGQDLQYTYRTAIEYKDDGSPFKIDWLNPGKFTKGEYTVILYADGYTMGRLGFKLK